MAVDMLQISSNPWPKVRHHMGSPTCRQVATFPMKSIRRPQLAENGGRNLSTTSGKNPTCTAVTRPGPEVNHSEPVCGTLTCWENRVQSRCDSCTYHHISSHIYSDFLCPRLGCQHETAGSFLTEALGLRLHMAIVHDAVLQKSIDKELGLRCLGQKFSH